MKSAASTFHRLGIFLLLIGLFAPLVPPEAAAQDEEPAATGALQIWVTGSDGLALSGASFQIVDAAGATFTTASSNGLATASGLAEGWATVVQTGAAGAYHVATGSLDATIVGGATVDLSVINTAPPPPDADGDGIPDAQDRTPYGESDSDDIPDDADNCPSITNPGQEDADGDGIGDACDETPFPVVDSDGNGIPDDQDSTPHGESDADDIPDDLDNCPTADNPGQEDADGDGIGDACAEPGDSAAAEDDVGFGIMAVGVWLDVFVAHPGDSPTYSIFAKPGDVIEVHVIADNSLGEEAETVTITGTVPSQITITSISSNLPCTSALPTSGNTASCTATVAAGSTLDMVFTGTVNATPTETDCVAGLAPTGVMSPAGYDNQAQIDLDCPISTVPVAPTFAAGTCVNSTFTPAMVTETPTPGVIYTYDPPLDKVLVHGGLVSIFANLQSGYSWGDFASPWLVTPGSPGVLHLPPGFVTVPSCITAVAEVSNDGGTTYHSAVSAGPGDELSLAMTITNIGGDFIVNGLISGDRLPSFVELTSPTIGCSLPPTPEGPSLLCVLSNNLNHDESKTFSVTARIATTLSEGDCAAGFDWRVVPNNGGGAETFNGPASTAHISFDCPEQLAPQLPTITTPASCVNGVFTAPVITPDTTPGINYEYTPSLEVLAASGGQTTVRATKSDRDTWSVDETVWNVDGNTASATVDVTVPPCLTITKEVRTTVLNFSPGPVTVLANEIREFRITVTNTGSIATGYQVTDIIQAPLTMFSYTPNNPTCSYTIATATVTCSRTIDPGESQQLSIVVQTGNPTEVQCASGVDNAATLTQINGQTTTQASNTVHLAYNCAPVVPELATKTNGSCSSSGVYTAPTFVKKTTPGIIYTYSATEDGNTEIDPSSPEFLATGGEVYVFARLDAGAVWGSLDNQVWFEVLGEPGTYVSYFYVSAPPCLAITKQVSTGEAYTNGPITVAPRGEADIRISVTNTGTTAVEYELTDTLAAPLGFVGGVSGCAIDGLTVTCDGTIEPGETETFDFTIMVLDPSAAQCDTSVTNTASLAYLNEWGQNVAHTSNTVSFAIECEKVTPELPEIAGGSCVNGVYTVSFKEATTDGISYSYNRDINDFLATGGDLTITATLDSGKAWGTVDTATWTQVGAAYTATIPIVVPPCVSIGLLVSADGGGTYHAEVEADPLTDVYYRVTIANTGNLAADVSFDLHLSPHVSLTAVFNLSVDCQTISLNPPIQSCSTREPLPASQSLVVTYQALIKGSLEPATCAAGLDGTASLTSLDGTPVAVQSTAHVDLTCAGPVTPELPTATDGSCVDGVYTALTFTPPSTDGITYSYDREIADFLATGGNLTITATLDGGQAWGAVDSTEWTPVGETYTATVSAKAPPCLAINVTIMKRGVHAYMWTVVVTNTGGPATDIQFSNTFPTAVSAIFDDANYERYSGVSCDSANAAGFSCTIASLSQGAATGVDITLTDTTASPLSASQCATGIDTVASITSVNGQPVSIPSNTAQLTFTCAHPELPTIVDGSCLNGDYTAPEIDEVENGGGLTYTYEPSLDEIKATGGDLTITATIDFDHEWGPVSDDWTVSGNTATAIVSIVNPPCVSLDLLVSQGGGERTSTITVQPGTYFQIWATVRNHASDPANMTFILSWPPPSLFDGPEVACFPRLGNPLNCLTFAPLAAGESRLVWFGAGLRAPQSEAACAAGIDIDVDLTATNGGVEQKLDRSVHVTLDCSNQSVPGLPEVTPGSCIDGDYTAPRIIEDTTPGMSYSYQPSLDAIKTTGGDLTITADIESGYLWGVVDTTIWDQGTINYTTVVPIEAPPCLTLVKSVPANDGSPLTGDVVIGPGDGLAWNLDVTNTGGPAINVSITDEFPFAIGTGTTGMTNNTVCTRLDGTGVACTFPSIASGTTSWVFVSALVSAEYLSPEHCNHSYTNTAAITSVNGESASIVSNTVNLTIACDTVVPEIPTHTDGSCLDGVHTAPTVLEVITEGISYTYDRDLDDWLAMGGDLEITATLTDFVGWGTIDEAWTVSATTATTTITVEAPPCLTFTKEITSGDGPYAPGDAVTYELVVTNTGTVVLPAVRVTDPILGALDCVLEDFPVISLPVALLPSKGLTCAGTYTVTQDDLERGSPLINTATASSARALTVTDSATAILIAHQPGISLQKTVSPETITAPGSLAYTFRIENTGNVTLNNVALADPDLNLTPLDCDAGQDGAQPLPTTLAPHAVVTCTTAVEVGQGQIDAGDPVVNTATVSARTPADATISSSSSATVTITQTPSLTLHKSASQTTVSAPQTITYTFSIQNMGNVTLTNLALIDPRIDLAQLDCGPADGVQPLPSTLAVGSDAITCTAPYTVSQAQIDARQPITNTAQVTSDQANSTESSTTITVVPTDGLSLVTSVTPTTVDAPGDVTFTFVIHNQGSASATGLALIDSLVDLDAVDCDPADDIQELPTTLAAGASVTCTVPYAIDQDMIDARQPIMSTAQVTSDQADSSQATATVTIVPIDGLSLVKSVAPNTMDAPGTITYTLVIANNGSAAISGIELADPHIDLVAVDCDPATDGVQAIPATLAAGETVTCTVPYTVTQNQIDAGTAITNTARVTSDQADSNESSATVTIAQRPAVSLVKSVDLATVDAPGTVTYTFTIQNMGNVTLTSVALVDPLVDHALIDCDPDTDGAQGILDILAVGADAVTCTVPVAITQDDIDGGQPIASTAQAISSQTSSNEANATVTITQTPRLTLGKSVSPDTVTTPDEVTYTFTVQNTGNVTLTNVALIDPWVDAGLIDCDPADGVQRVPTTLAVGSDAVTCSVDHAISQDQIDARQPVVNMAHLTSDQVDSNEASATITVAPTDGLGLIMSVSPTMMSAPGAATFTIVIQNQGSASVTGVALTTSLVYHDLLDCDPAADDAQGVPSVLAAGASLTCTLPYDVTQDEIDAGAAIANTARVVSDQVESDEAGAMVSITQDPKLSLSKTVSPVTIDAPGDVTYTFTIQNTGNVTLTNVALVDPHKNLDLVDCDPADGIRGVPVTLPVGSDAVVCSAPYAVSQGQVDARLPIVNTARVTSDQVTSNSSTATITVVPVDGLGLVTSVAPQTVDAPGTVTFTFAITNGGTAEVTGLALVDPLVDLASVDCDPDTDGIQPLPATLAATAGVICTADYDVSQGQIDLGVAIVNSAHVTSDQVDSNAASATVTITQAPVLSLAKSVDQETINAPSEVTYTFTIQNTGNVTLTNITLVDPAIDLDLVDCDPATDGAQGVPGTLAVGSGTTICTVPFDIDQNDIDAGNAIVNTAQVTSDQVTSNTSTSTVTITQIPGLTLGKAVEPASVDAPRDVTYTFTVQNTGNVTLTNVALIDPHVDLHLVDCDPAMDGAQSPPTSLAVGSDAISCSVDYFVTQAQIDAGEAIANTARVVSDQVDSNEASATMAIVQAPELTLEKVVAPATIGASGSVTYTFTIQNTGNVTLAGLSLVDPHVDHALIDCDPADGVQGVPDTLAVGSEAIACTVDFLVTQAQIDARQPLINTAQVTSDQVNSNEASATITIVPTDSLGLAKSVDPDMVDAPGEVIFTFAIANGGGAVLSDVELIDDAIDLALVDCDPATNGVQSVPTTLAAGASVTCTAPYTITQADIDAGEAIVNTAQVTSDQADSNESTATITITQAPELTLAKAVAPAIVSEPGNVTYTFTIQNTGNVTLTNVALVDPAIDAEEVDCDLTMDGSQAPPSSLAVGSDPVICSVPYAVSQAQIDARQPIVNTAQVTSDQINSNTSTATITVVTVDGLNLVTSVAPESVSAPGTVTFTFVIANDGTGEATGLELVDALIDQRMIDCDPATDGIQGVPAALGAGVTIACAVPFDVDQDDIDAGEAIVTTARATSDQVASNESTATITITQAPALTLEKAVEPTTVDSLGNVTYSFTTQNTGNVTLTGIQLIDPHIDIHLVDCDPAADGAQSLPTMLAVGSDAVTCAVPYAIDQDDLDAGTPIENSAQVTSDQVASNESSATVTIEQRPGVSLQKAVAPVTISAAGEVTYAFTIKNTGNLTLTGIELIDPRVDPALIDCDPESDGAQAVPSTLAVGSDAVTCTVPYEIDQDQVDARQPVVNTAMVTSDQVDSAESSATVTIVPVDGLSLVASVDPSSVDALGEVTFTFVIENHGGARVSGLALDATLIDRDLLDCDPADGIQGVPSSLGAGDGVICTVPHTVTQNTIDAGDPLTTGATATSDQAASNEASATVSIIREPEIAVTKTVTSATSDLDTGDLVTYAITVTNTGNVTLSDIEVLDPGADIMDCGTMPDALAPDGVVECTASTELTEVHLLAGSYTNEVSVRAVFRAPAVDAQPRARTFGFAQMDDTVLAVESTATATVTMRAVVVGLTLEHSVEPAGPVRVGDTLTYTFVVTNTGNVGLHEVAIHAPLAGLVWDPAYPDGVIGTLPRDTTVTVTATYVVTPADAEVGRVAIETVVVAVDPTCEPEDDCRLAVEPSEAGGETVIEPDPVNPEPTATVEPTVPGATPTETSESTPGATEAPATEVAGDTPGTVTDLPTTGHGVERSISLLHLGLLLAAGLALVAGIGRVVETRRRT